MIRILFVIVLGLAACTPPLPTVSPIPNVTPDATAETTPDITPTAELLCVPDSYVTVPSGTWLYVDSTLHEKHAAVAGVLLFAGIYQDDAAYVVTVDDPLVEGWLPLFVVPDDCK
jgi:hypothetical protein